MSEDIFNTIKQLDLQISQAKAEYDALVAARNVLQRRLQFSDTHRSETPSASDPYRTTDSSTPQGEAAEPLSSQVKESPSSKTPSPDELKLEKYQGQPLNEILKSVCQDIQGEFSADDLVPKIYSTTTDDEFQACKRSLNAALSRAVNDEKDNFLVRRGRGVFALKAEQTGVASGTAEEAQLISAPEGHNNE